MCHVRPGTKDGKHRRRSQPMRRRCSGKRRSGCGDSPRCYTAGSFFRRVLLRRRVETVMTSWSRVQSAPLRGKPDPYQHRWHMNAQSELRAPTACLLQARSVKARARERQYYELVSTARSGPQRDTEVDLGAAAQAMARQARRHIIGSVVRSVCLKIHASRTVMPAGFRSRRRIQLNLVCWLGFLVRVRLNTGCKPRHGFTLHQVYSLDNRSSSSSCCTQGTKLLALKGATAEWDGQPIIRSVAQPKSLLQTPLGSALKPAVCAEDIKSSHCLALSQRHLITRHHDCFM